MSELAPSPLQNQSQETAELLLKVLRSMDEPKSLSQIIGALPKAARPEPGEASRLMAELVQSGRIYEFPPVRGRPQYWKASQEEYASARLLRQVERGPATESQIFRSVAKLAALQGLPKATLKQIFSRLQREGRIYKLPPYLQARTPLFSNQAADPRDYVEDALRRLSVKLGVSVEQLIDSLPARTDVTADAPRVEPPRARDNRITEAMLDLDPRVRQGAMVSIAELRKLLSAHLVGEEFDRALLAESAAGVVALHLFDRPALIPDDQRALLLRDEKGNYYNTVSLRNYQA